MASLPSAGEGRPRDDPTTVRVREALAGDHRSLGWVITRLTPLLRAQATHRIGPELRRHLEPDDVVAEAWLVGLRRLRDIAGRDGRATPRLLAFLSETIVRKVNDHLKKCLRRGQLGSAWPGADSGSDPLAILDAEVTGIVTQAVRHEHSGAVDEALAQLSAKDREVVILRGIEGRGNDEVARELDALSTTISHRYRRALVKLRELLPESVFEELREG